MFKQTASPQVPGNSVRHLFLLACLVLSLFTGTAFSDYSVGNSASHVMLQDQAPTLLVAGLYDYEQMYGTNDAHPDREPDRPTLRRLAFNEALQELIESPDRRTLIDFYYVLRFVAIMILYTV